MQSVARTVSPMLARGVATMTKRSVAAAKCFPVAAVRPMSINVSAANPDTPGYEPGVGNRLMKTIYLRKAQTWDEAKAQGFKKHTYDDLFADKKVVVFALPGAFTGTCEKAHVPSYGKNIEEFKKKGINSIICVSVNDAYCMNAWLKVLGDKAAGIEFFADSDGSFTHFMHKEHDFNGAGLGPSFRSQRYSMMVDNGIIKKMFVEKDHGNMDVSGGDHMLKNL